MLKTKLIRYGHGESRLVLPLLWAGYLVVHKAPDGFNVFWRRGASEVRRLYQTSQPEMQRNPEVLSEPSMGSNPETESEPGHRRKPKDMSEPGFQRKPSTGSEPGYLSNPDKVSEPDIMRTPGAQSETR